MERMDSSTSIMLDRLSPGSQKKIKIPVTFADSNDGVASASRQFITRNEQKRYTNPTKPRTFEGAQNEAHDTNGTSDSSHENNHISHHHPTVFIKQSFTNITSRFAVAGGVSKTTVLRRISSSNQNTSEIHNATIPLHDEKNSSSQYMPNANLAIPITAATAAFAELNSPISSRTPGNRKPLRYSNSIAYVRPHPLDTSSARTQNNNNYPEMSSSTTEIVASPLTSSRRDLLSPFPQQHLQNKKTKFFNDLLKSMPSIYSKRLNKAFESGNSYGSNNSQMKSQTSFGIKPKNQVIRPSVALTSPVSAFKPDSYTPTTSSWFRLATTDRQYQTMPKPILKSRSTSTNNNNNNNNQQQQQQQNQSNSNNNIPITNEKPKSSRTLQFQMETERGTLHTPRDRFGISTSITAPTTADEGSAFLTQSTTHRSKDNHRENPYQLDRTSLSVQAPNQQQQQQQQQQPASQLKKKLNGMQVGFTPTKQQMGRFAIPGVAATKQFTTFQDLADQAQTYSKKSVINSLKPNKQELLQTVQEQAAQFFPSKKLQKMHREGTSAATTATNNSHYMSLTISGMNSSTSISSLRNSTTTPAAVATKHHFISLQSPTNLHSQSFKEHSPIKHQPSDMQYYNNNNEQSDQLIKKSKNGSGSSMLSLHLKNLFTKKPSETHFHQFPLTARLEQQSSPIKNREIRESITKVKSQIF